jgi:hypothetical protein
MMPRPKPLNFDAPFPKEADADCLQYGFWRAWGRRRAAALGNAVRRIRQLEHEVRVLRARLAKRSRKASGLAAELAAIRKAEGRDEPRAT